MHGCNPLADRIAHHQSDAEPSNTHHHVAHRQSDLSPDSKPGSDAHV